MCSWDHDCAAVTEAEDLAAGAQQQQQPDMLFWFDEAVFEDTTLLADEAKDHLVYTPAATARCLQVENTLFHREESARISPRSNQDSHRIDDAEKKQLQQPDEAKDIAVDVVPEEVPVTDYGDGPVATSPEEASVEGNHTQILCLVTNYYSVG